MNQLNWQIVGGGSWQTVMGLADLAELDRVDRDEPVEIFLDDDGLAVADVATLRVARRPGERNVLAIAHGIPMVTYGMAVARATQAVVAGEGDGGIAVHIEPGELELFLAAAAGNPWTADELVAFARRYSEPVSAPPSPARASEHV